MTIGDKFMDSLTTDKEIEQPKMLGSLEGRLGTTKKIVAKEVWIVQFEENPRDYDSAPDIVGVFTSKELARAAYPNVIWTDVVSQGKDDPYNNYSWGSNTGAISSYYAEYWMWPMVLNQNYQGSR